jgi:hypothetical protein
VDGYRYALCLPAHAPVNLIPPPSTSTQLNPTPRVGILNPPRPSLLPSPADRAASDIINTPAIRRAQPHSWSPSIAPASILNYCKTTLTCDT